MTREKLKILVRGYFANIEEVERAFHNGFFGLHAKIKLKISIQNEEKPTEIIETTTGRALFSKIVPDEIPFAVINKTMDSKEISRLINHCYREVGLKATVIFADKLMYLGFEYATKSGVSIALDDMVVPENKEEILSDAESCE